METNDHVLHVNSLCPEGGCVHSRIDSFPAGVLASQAVKTGGVETTFLIKRSLSLGPPLPRQHLLFSSLLLSSGLSTPPLLHPICTLAHTIMALIKHVTVTIIPWTAFDFWTFLRRFLRVWNVEGFSQLERKREESFDPVWVCVCVLVCVCVMFCRSDVNTVIVCVQTVPLNPGEEAKNVKQRFFDMHTNSISPHVGIYLGVFLVGGKTHFVLWRPAPEVISGCAPYPITNAQIRRPPPTGSHQEPMPDKSRVFRSSLSRHFKVV